MMQSILDKHKTKALSSQPSQPPKLAVIKEPVDSEKVDEDNKMDTLPPVISDSEEPNVKKSKPEMNLQPTSETEKHAVDNSTKLDQGEPCKVNESAMDVDQLNILPLPTTETDLTKSRPSSALSSSTNSTESSLKAYSTSDDNSPIDSEVGDDTELQTPVTPLLTPPKIVITDFSFDEPKNVEDEDPFKNVAQQPKTVSFFAPYFIFIP